MRPANSGSGVPSARPLVEGGDVGRRRTKRRQPTDVPPSHVAVQRLAHQLGGEVSHLRDGLDNDLSLLLLLIGGGDLHEAAGLVDAQSERLRSFEADLQRVVAAAVAEREAEAVVAAAQARRHRRLPTALAATTAVGASLFLAVVAGPLPNPIQLVAGDARTSGLDQPAGETAGPDADATVGTSPRRMPGAVAGEPDPEAARLVTSRDGLEVLRLMGRQGRWLARIAGDHQNGPMAALLGVEEVVARLVPEATSTLPVVAPQAVAEPQAGQADDPAPARNDPAAQESTRASHQSGDPAPAAGEPAPAGKPGSEPGTEPANGASEPAAPQEVEAEPKPSASPTEPSPQRSPDSAHDEATGVP